MRPAILALLVSLALCARSYAFDNKGIGDNGPIDPVDQSPQQLARTIADFGKLGVQWFRLDFPWSRLEPSRGRYDFSGHDAVVRAFGKAGIEVLGVIAYSPGWANGGAPSSYYPPLDPADYARFAGRLAARYAPLGVHAWEIWNEENLGHFWGPAPSVAAYARLLRGAYRAIHAVDPRAQVIVGGLAQPRASATTITAMDFLESLYAAGAGRYFDALADHPYNSPRLPSDSSAVNNWQRMFATSRSLRSIMSDNGDRGKKIWITEYGAPTGGISAFDRHGVVTEDLQQTMLRQAYALVATYEWAGPLFWYEYQDLCPPAAKRETECYYGLLRFDGSKKPAYAAYRAAPN